MQRGKGTLLRAVLLIGAALLMSWAAGRLSTPLPLCRVTVERIGVRSVPLQQQLIRTTIAPECMRPRYAVIRYRTAEGGILPPLGHLKLRPGYPRQERYWLRPGGSVQLKQDDGRWITVWRLGG